MANNEAQVYDELTQAVEFLTEFEKTSSNTDIKKGVRRLIGDFEGKKLQLQGSVLLKSWLTSKTGNKKTA